MKLSVVMPVYDEKATIRQIIDKELIIVDDGSTDGTREILKDLEPSLNGAARIFYMDHNRGKGAAVRYGIAQATGDVLVIQDADLEYEPEEYHNLLEPLKK